MKSELSFKECSKCRTYKDVNYILGLSGWYCDSCAAHEAHSKFDETCERCRYENLIIQPI